MHMHTHTHTHTHITHTHTHTHTQHTHTHTHRGQNNPAGEFFMEITIQCQISILQGEGAWHKVNKHLFQLIQKYSNFTSIIFPEKTSTKNKFWGYTDMIIRFMDLKIEWQKTVLIFVNYFSLLTWSIFSKKKSTLNDFQNAKNVCS